MEIFSLEDFNSPKEIPRKYLLTLLKSDDVPETLLSWASEQVDREIAYAILMNSKTSLQHLEKLFETFYNHFGFDAISIYDESRMSYPDYFNAWDILENICDHVNWEQKELKDNWHEDILSEIAAMEYHDINYYDSLHYYDSLVKTLKLDWELPTEGQENTFQYDLMYKKIFDRLRKIRAALPKRKPDNSKSHINQSEIALARKTNNIKEIKKLLIVKDSEFKIKYALLENPHLTQEVFANILEYTLKRQDCIKLLANKRFKKYFHKYPQITREFLEKIYQRKDNNNQWSFFLAKCPHTPIKILKKLARHNNNGILARLAANPSTPEPILLDLVKETHYEINRGLRCNPNLPNSVSAKLPAVKYSDWELAYRDDTSVQDLRRIAISPDNYREKIHVFLNPNTNLEILEILAEDSDYEVRLNVAKHPEVPLNILEYLADDEDERVRYAVIENPRVNKEKFHDLMDDIYKNCDYSLGCLLALLDPHVPIEILEKHADSLLWNERYVIAIHPKTPQKIINQLAKDGNIYVRAAALER